MIDKAFSLMLRTCGMRERRLSIVLFHRVLAQPDPLLVDEPDVERFARQIRWLRDSFTVLPLREAAERLYADSLPAGALCVTFDDGYRDNVLNALPVLCDLGVPATFFVTTRFLDGGMMWNDRVVESVRAWRQPAIVLERYGLPDQDLALGRDVVMENLLECLKYRPFDERDAIASELFERSGAPTRRMMMNADEIRSLHAAGMEIGGHTVSHPILTSLDPGVARREIADNKARLEAVIGEALVLFAYPNGRPGRDYDASHMRMVRECGYRYASSTSRGTASSRTSPLQLPRFTPWDRSRGEYLARMLGNYFVEPECLAEPG